MPRRVAQWGSMDVSPGWWLGDWMPTGGAPQGTGREGVGLLWGHAEVFLLTDLSRAKGSLE